ncbi:MAG: flagellar protein FliT [Gemmatimonadetes bacterium]|nr:flagellar protein FliT [Gemmatimonadota bacterium]
MNRFRELAQDFRAAAVEGDLERMESVLGRRQQLLGELERLRRETPPSGRAAFHSVVEEILAEDRASEESLLSWRDRLGEALAETTRGRRGLEGYGALHSGAGKWIDERS